MLFFGLGEFIYTEISKDDYLLYFNFEVHNFYGSSDGE